MCHILDGPLSGKLCDIEDHMVGADRYWSDPQPFPVLGRPLSKTKCTWQEERGEIRWLNCSLTIRPSLKRTLSNQAKVAKGGGSWRKGWKKRALKHPLSKWERGRGPCYWGPDRAKGAQNSLQSCTVLFCSIKWHGGQGWDNGLLSQRRRPAAPEESSFSAHMVVAPSQDAPLTAAACSASGHIRSLLSDHCSVREGNGVSLVTLWWYSRIQGSTQEIKERKYFWMEWNPNFVGFRVTEITQQMPQQDWNTGRKKKTRISPMQIISLV